MAGTDAIQRFGDFALGLELLHRAGLSPMEVIVAATSLAAKAIGMERTVGTLKPGMAADLIYLDGDPLADLSALSRVEAVVLGGELVVDRRRERVAELAGKAAERGEIGFRRSDGAGQQRSASVRGWHKGMATSSEAVVQPSGDGQEYSGKPSARSPLPGMSGSSRRFTSLPIRSRLASLCASRRVCAASGDDPADSQGRQQCRIAGQESAGSAACR